MQNKTITIFGGTGFIGRHIVAALAADGWQIKIACRVPARGYFLKAGAAPGQIVPMYCNVHDDASVAAIIEGSSHVLNLIGILYQKGKSTFQKMHVDVPERLARLAAAANVADFVHVSALGADRDGASRYARSKAEGEEKIRTVFPAATILRPSIVFGPGDHFFGLFASMAQKAPVLPLIGFGKTLFQPVYVGDIAQAVLRIVSNQTHWPRGKTFALTGPETLSFRALLQRLRQETGQKFILLPIPFLFAKPLGAVLGLLPRPPLTLDQVQSLTRDNVAAPGDYTLHDLNLDATALSSVLPAALRHFRQVS
jgi:NADH dehydrogenase